MMPSVVMSLSWASNSTLASKGTLHFPCWTSEISGSTSMLYSSGMLPILLNDSRKLFKTIFISNLYMVLQLVLHLFLQWEHGGGWGWLPLGISRKDCSSESHGTLCDSICPLCCLTWLWHKTLSSPNWVLTVCEIIISFSVSTMKCLTGVTKFVL